MAPGEHRFLVGGTIPVLKVHHEPRPPAAVVVLHGLGASADAQRMELGSLAEAGFSAVAIDAPHHGRRHDEQLEAMRRLPHPASHAAFLRLLLEAIPEVSRVIDHLLREGHGPVALLGISLGAFTALGAARADARVACTVSILGSPDWTPAEGVVTDELEGLMGLAPMHAPRELTRAPLLLLNASRDRAVPPAAPRAFAARNPSVQYVEYPESEHLMRPEDWDDLWRRSLRFLHAHLSGPPSNARVLT